MLKSQTWTDALCACNVKMAEAACMYVGYMFLLHLYPLPTTRLPRYHHEIAALCAEAPSSPRLAHILLTLPLSL